ncbi:hypothetical protein SNEBB_000107 [Seison nebaliae]|nr:hypothetical protein SNEBB_000107 [Seison nebaliae]
MYWSFGKLNPTDDKYGIIDSHYIRALYTIKGNNKLHKCPFPYFIMLRLRYLHGKWCPIKKVANRIVHFLKMEKSKNVGEYGYEYSELLTILEIEKCFISIYSATELNIDQMINSLDELENRFQIAENLVSFMRKMENIIEERKWEDYLRNLGVNTSAEKS